MRAPDPIDVFISYVAEDDTHAQELEKHLALLTREGLIRPWSQRRIGAGEDWRSVVHRNLEGARLILLLISPDYFASDYSHDVEMQRALDRHRLGVARVVPIIVRPVDWRGSKFDLLNLAVLPEGGKPITHRDWGDVDRAWSKVASALRGIVLEFAGAASSAPRGRGPAYVTGVGGATTSTGTVRPGTRPGGSSAPVAARNAPVEQVSSAAASARRSRWSWAFAGCAGGLVAVLGVVVLVVYLVYRALSGGGGGGVPHDTLPPESTPTHDRTVVPPRRMPPAPAPACQAPCCAGVDCVGNARDTAESVCDRPQSECVRCASGRSCVPGACRTMLDYASPWLLRLAGTTVPDVPPNARVCVKRAGAPASSWKCTLLSQAGTDAARATGLPITTVDVLKGNGRGIDVAIAVGDAVIAATSRSPAASAWNVKHSALCTGVELHSVDLRGTVSFYLDDPQE